MTVGVEEGGDGGGAAPEVVKVVVGAVGVLRGWLGGSGSVGGYDDYA